MVQGPARTTLDVTQLTRLRRLTAAVPSPCGRWLVVAAQRLADEESRYVSDLWRVSVADASISPVRLTYTDSDDRAPRFRRDGALGFLSDRLLPGEGPRPPDSARRAQVWLFDAAGGEPAPLTDEPLGVMDFRFAGERLVVAAGVVPGVPAGEQRASMADRRRRGPSGLRYTASPVRQWNQWVPQAAPHFICYEPDGARRDLTPDADDAHRTTDQGLEWDASPTGRHVVVATRAPRTSGLTLYDVFLRVIELDGGGVIDVPVASGASHELPRFSPDGVAIASVRAMRQRSVADVLDLWLTPVPESGAAVDGGRVVAAGWDVWPRLAGWSADSAGLIVTADVGGHHPVYRVILAHGGEDDRVERVTAIEAAGAHASVCAVGGDDGRGRVVGLRHTLIHPPEPFVCDLAARATPALIGSLSGFSAAEGAAIAALESFDVQGRDGASIQSFAVTPRSPGPHPAVLFIHGGPMSQNTDGWHWRWNPLLMAAAGYAVFLPNPRGSTGFGQAFIQGIADNQWGAACYDDLMIVADAVAERADVAAGRVAAMGGSFGGYMVNWIGGSTDRFRCLVSHAGLYDLSAFWGTTDYPDYFTLEMGLAPSDDPAAFDRYSPHTRLAAWKTPTLVIHGEKDYRVPIGEALALFHGLLGRGVEVELLVFPDEDHWIMRPQNTRQWYESALAFLARYMHLDMGDTAQS